MGIDKLNGTLAAQIATQLDKADGNQDGKISASIWNDFVNDKGGKEVQNSISVEDAIKSIATYAVRVASKSQIGQTVNDIAKTWLSALGGAEITSTDETISIADDPNPPQAETPPATDQNPPAADLNPPQKEDGKVATGVPNPQYAGQKISNSQTGKIEEYDKNGNLVAEYDKNGNKTKEIKRNEDGSVNYYEEYEYDENGNSTKYVMRNADGSVDYYLGYEPEKNTKVKRNADGSVDRYNVFEYDENGNKTKIIIRNADGSVNYYNEYEYDNSGNNTKVVQRNADGTVDGYTEYEYDENGNPTKMIERNEDGYAYDYCDDIDMIHRLMNRQ